MTSGPFLTQAQAREAVYERFKTQWDILHPGFAYTMEGMPGFVEPSNPETPWARLSLRHQQSSQETLGPVGARNYARPAMIWVQFFNPINWGLGNLDDYCDQAMGFLEGATYGGITPSGGAYPREIGEDGRWYEVVLVVPITYYALK